MAAANKQTEISYGFWLENASGENDQTLQSDKD